MVRTVGRLASIAGALSDEELARLLRLRDPLGVLSVFADTRAGEGVRHGPRAGEITVRGKLDELVASLRRDGPRERWRALRDRLDGLSGELDWLCDPGASGRGHALFAPLSGGTRLLACWRAFPNEVVLESSAYLRPLLAPLDAGRPVGIAVASAQSVRLIDWRFGQASEVLRRPIPDESVDWRRLQGPGPTNPAHVAQSSAQRDLFDRRLAEHRRGFLAAFASEVARAAGERGWTRLALAGEPRMAHGLGEALAGGALEIVSSPFVPPDSASATEVADAVVPDLERARLHERAVRAAEVREAGLTPGGAAALGLDETLAALDEGRVRELLIDPACERTGRRSPDGRLMPAGELLPGTSADELCAEPHLVERMIERALDTGARVTALEGRAAEHLGPWGGIAARLRW